MQAEGQLDLACLADLAHGGVERAQQADAAVVAEADAVAGGQALGRPRERPPAARIDALVQVEGDVRAGVAAPPLALQRRADHARVVEHQRIAGSQQFGQIAHEAILERGSLSPLFRGERVRVRGGRLLRRLLPPLTPTLSRAEGALG